MRNILDIAERELRSYFASPIAYAVIGFFALVFGWMFYTFLRFFVMQSMQMSQMGMRPGQVNVNQAMIRPLILQISVVTLFVLPMITMRTYSEEKRSGTIELLLTSPVSDLEIILGKFLGALGLYALMLLITVPTITLLMLLLVSWMQDFVGPVGQSVISALAVFEHFEDYSNGVIDTKHLVYYASVIT